MRTHIGPTAKFAVVITLAILLVAITGLFACKPAPKQLRVLAIHSYHEGWGWNQDIQKGIIEGLGRLGFTEGQDYKLKSFYMDTKVTYTTPEQIQQRAAAALGLIDEFKPDLVFVNDDDAFKYVAIEYTEKHPDRRLPFVFSGVNADPSAYNPIKSLDKPGAPITGALERFPFPEAFSLAKRISPQASSILILADSSPSSTFVINSFKGEYLDKISPPLQVIGPFQLKTFAEWQNLVIEYQTKVDFLGIITYHQLRDEASKIVPAPQVVDWTIHNSRLPEVGFLTFHAEDGFLSAAGVSGYKTGIYAGVIGGEILQGSDPAAIPIIDPQVTDVVFNLERARMLGIKIPATELIRAANVFHSVGKRY